MMVPIVCKMTEAFSANLVAMANDVVHGMS